MASVDSFLSQLETDPRFRERIVHRCVDSPREAVFAPFPEELPAALRAVLSQRRPEGLYQHQRDALDSVAAGRNVVVATETASGKSLCFHIPVLSAAITDPGAHSLFIFPTNALANDQEKALNDLVTALPVAARPRSIAKLRGGQGSEKRRLAAADPQIVLTNPEMVHLHLLPQHEMWARFWRGLKFIVVDEMHLYRGAFGGHMAMLLRRVRRCAWKYGAKPQVIAATATVGNPKQLAEELCATEFTLVDRSTSAKGHRTTILWRPETLESGTSDDALMLFKSALFTGLQTILFARSRKQVEDLVLRLERDTGKSRGHLKVRAYRGGYDRDEREAIEGDLRDGTVRGVVTTNALEVGIDIGSLDVCISAGYPGTLMALRQQMGRVGRRDRASVAFLVASSNPVDAFLLSNPRQLAEAPSETAVIARHNPAIVGQHVAATAFEFALSEKELDRLGGEVAHEAARQMIERGVASWTDSGGRRTLSAQKHAWADTGLRSTTEQWKFISPDGEEFGELDGATVPRMAHPGAIYQHQTRTFRVRLLENRCIYLDDEPRGRSTRAVGTRTVSCVDVRKSVALVPGVRALLGTIDVVDRYEEYLEFVSGGKPERRPILPPCEARMRTDGMMIAVDDEGMRRMTRGSNVDISIALHGAEHLLSAFAATLVLCDRDDIEGHTPEGGRELTLFDRHPGGIGFVAAAFEQLSEVVVRAGAAIDACECRDGCPACVQSARCLRNNADLSKGLTRALLRHLRGLPASFEVAEPQRVARTTPRAVPRAPVAVPKPVFRRRTMADGRRTFARGDVVEHPSYGRGHVTDVVGEHVHVVFGNGKSRILAAKWLAKHTE